MVTEIAIDSRQFIINGRPTYAGKTYKGKSIEGLLFNSRMIQAVFDDENPDTRSLWKYPDTATWDPDRNTDEFCAQLPTYYDRGLRAVTVGLQGGGSIYAPEVYDRYVNSAFAPDGSFKEPYFDRLLRVIMAADEAGMIVIVNYLYWKQAEKIPNDDTIKDIVARTTEWLLGTGHRNILVDIFNESGLGWDRALFKPDRVHEVLDVVQNTTVDGRRLLASVSTCGGDWLPEGKWLEMEDFSLPHGNGCTPEKLKAKLVKLQETDAHKSNPRPIAVNEDSIGLDNLEAAVECGCSWGFYCQGYGCRGDHDRHISWKEKLRETEYDELSGFQTVPVNWHINTPVKKAFFDRLELITG